MLEVGDGDRAALGGDAAREAAAERDAHALLDLLLDALRGARVYGIALHQQDRHGVDVEGLRHAFEQLLQQLLLRQVGERRVRDPLQRLEPPCRGLRGLARDSLRVQRATFLDRQRGAVAGELEQVALRSENTRGVRLPTCSTPVTRPCTRSGTPSRDLMPFSRRIGLRMSAWSTS